jgi:5-methylcytosine-specific restriction endonuclease McrA
MNDRPKCRICGGLGTAKGYNESGARTYHKMCYSCKKKPYTRHKKTNCELCGFIPIHRCQLDVDHIDGNKKNNNLNNLQTLCANCHRLKTYVNSDWETRKESFEDKQLVLHSD